MSTIHRNNKTGEYSNLPWWSSGPSERFGFLDSTPSSISVGEKEFRRDIGASAFSSYDVYREVRQDPPSNPTTSATSSGYDSSSSTGDDGCGCIGCLVGYFVIMIILGVMGDPEGSLRLLVGFLKMLAILAIITLPIYLIVRRLPQFRPTTTKADP